MSDAAMVGRLLDEYHCRHAGPAVLRRLSGSERGPRASYLVRPADGTSQVIRAFRSDEPVPVHARDHAVPCADWLLGRARTLSFLAAAGYPAPRPVLTRTRELIAVAGPWLAWATTYVPGDVITPTPSQLRLVGAALGRLHSVPVVAPAGERDPRLAAASADPLVTVRAILDRLAAVRPLMPAALVSLHAEIAAIASAVGAAVGAESSLRRSLVHGDPWARNAVQSAPDAVTFIDWETAGLGCAVLDLGHCLMECHLDSAEPDGQPQPWLISANEERIGAVAAGYASVCSLSPAEIVLLPWAVRYPAAVVGAIHLEAALIDGVRGPAMDARLARLRNRLAVAEGVAAAALRYLAPRAGS